MARLTTLIFVFLALSAVVFGSVARRHDAPPDGHAHRSGCLTKDEAEDLRDQWISFFVAITDGGVAASNRLTHGFKLYSESINNITPNRTLPIDAPQYNSKASFIAGQIQATTPRPNVPAASFDVIAWDYGCDSFTFRWRGHLVAGASGIAGIDFVFVQKGDYLLEKAYSEFNNFGLLLEYNCTVSCGM